METGDKLVKVIQVAKERVDVFEIVRIEAASDLRVDGAHQQ